MRTILRSTTVTAALLVAVSILATTGALPIANAWAESTIRVEKPINEGGYELRSELSLGGPEAPDEQQFYNGMGGIRVDADASGNMYVLDTGNTAIQVFDASGEFVRTIGSKGEGPGEYKMPTFMSVNSSGQVAIFDMASMRVTVFEADGSLSRDQLSGRPMQDLRLLDDGTLIAFYGDMGNGLAMEAFDTAGEVVWSEGSDQGERGRMRIEMNFDSGIGAGALTRTGGQYYHLAGREYGICRVDGGELVSTFVRPYDRQAFEMPSMGDDDGEEGDVQVVMITRGGGEGGGLEGGGDMHVSTGGEETLTFNGEELRSMMPKYTKDLSGLLGWPDGRIWALTSTVDGDRVVVDEWSPKGEYVRRFTLSNDYTWLSIGADGQLYGISLDEDEYPYVHRLEVTSSI